MPYGLPAKTIETATVLAENGSADQVGLAQGSPVCFDVSKVSGAITSRGVPITDAMSVTQFIDKPVSDNQHLFAGIAVGGMNLGDYAAYACWGATKALVNNPLSSTLTLVVGDLLVLVPGQAYLRPMFQAGSDGSGTIVVNRAAHPVAFIRKGVGPIDAGATVLAEVFVWPPVAPRAGTFSRYFDAAPGTITDFILGVPRGPGRVAAVGFGCATGGTIGAIELDLKIGTMSIWTIKPKINNDCVDSYHSLLDRQAPGPGSGPGSGGSYGALNYGNLDFTGDLPLKFSLTNTGSWDGTGLNFQVELVY